MVCVIYCRQSDVNNNTRSGEESPDSLSLEAQLNACRDFAARKGWTVLAAYSEQFSGFAEQRVQYQRMLKDIRTNHKAHPPGDTLRITQAVIYKYARLSRDPVTLTTTVSMLRSQGVEVEPCADQKLGAGKLDPLMMYNLSYFGKLQVEDSVEHAKAARKALTDRGLLVCSGKARFGYVYKTKTRTRVIDEPAAAVVRKIFGWYAEGYSAHKVMYLLQSEGIPSPSGKPRWTLKTIRDIVKDASYKGGAMVTGKTARTPEVDYYPSGVRKFKRTGTGTPVGDGTPAIVTEELWDEANRLASDRSRPTIPHGNDWLVGHVFCSTCQTRVARFRHMRGYWYWRCHNHQLYKSCVNKLGHALDRIVRADVVEKLARFLADPAVREAKLAQLRDTLADPTWEEEAQRNRAETDKLKAKIGKLLARFGDDDELAEMLGEQIADLKRQVAALDDISASLAGKAAAGRQAAEAVERVRGLLGPWPEGFLEGPDAPAAFEALPVEDKRLVAKTVGLRVEIAKSVEGQVAVRVNVFDFEFLNAYLTGPLPAWMLESLPLDTSRG